MLLLELKYVLAAIQHTLAKQLFTLKCAMSCLWNTYNYLQRDKSTRKNWDTDANSQLLISSLIQHKGLQKLKWHLSHLAHKFYFFYICKLPVLLTTGIIYAGNFKSINARSLHFFFTKEQCTKEMDNLKLHRTSLTLY